jgi:RNA polymerase sigma-70 factor (ECF subfamily)
MAPRPMAYGETLVASRTTTMNAGFEAGVATTDSRDQTALLAGLRGGDAASFAQVVGTWCAPMLAVARRLLNNEEDAKDCVQDGFITAFRKLDTFEGRSSIGTWLHRIVVNRALMKLRTRNRDSSESLDELLPRFDDTGHRLGRQSCFRSSVEELAERKEVQELVQRSIASLPDEYRAVVVLRDIEGYATREAAEELGLTESAVKVRLHRARAALRKMIEPLMGESK